MRAASWPEARAATRQAFEEAPRYKPQFKRADYGISRWATPRCELHLSFNSGWWCSYCVVTARRTVPLQQRLMDSKDTLAFRIGGGCRPSPFSPWIDAGSIVTAAMFVAIAKHFAPLAGNG